MNRTAATLTTHSRAISSTQPRSKVYMLITNGAPTDQFYVYHCPFYWVIRSTKFTSRVSVLSLSLCWQYSEGTVRSIWWPNINLNLRPWQSENYPPEIFMNIYTPWTKHLVLFHVSSGNNYPILQTHLLTLRSVFRFIKSTLIF